MRGHIAFALTSVMAVLVAGCSSLSTPDQLFDELQAVVDRPAATALAGPSEDPETIIALARAGGTVVHGAPRGASYISEARSGRPYLLDTGDRLRIFVYGQPNLSRLYAVDQSGIISVPLIGSVRARGLTTTQLEGAIRSRLGEQIVRDPQVTVDVQQNRPFFILGEVRTAGQYPYVSGMTVETAVAIAGGYADRASERRMRVTRRTGGSTEVLEVTPDFELEPGDSVYVQERFF